MKKILTFIMLLIPLITYSNEILKITDEEDRSLYFRQQIFSGLNKNQILNYLIKKEIAENAKSYELGAKYILHFLPPFDRKLDPSIGKRWEALSPDEKDAYRINWFNTNHNNISLIEIQKYTHIMLNDLIEKAREAERQRLKRSKLEKPDIKYNITEASFNDNLDKLLNELTDKETPKKTVKKKTIRKKKKIVKRKAVKPNTVKTDDKKTETDKTKTMQTDLNNIEQYLSYNPRNIDFDKLKQNYSELQDSDDNSKVYKDKLIQIKKNLELLKKNLNNLKPILNNNTTQENNSSEQTPDNNQNETENKMQVESQSQQTIPITPNTNRFNEILESIKSLE